ncbi:RSP_2648 family PIN domain-containing protein [Paracoccus tegillarcae]|uniref:PIN domain-containing protein n=1 Tax=Paracoccus tegillarcae TaxID=1529068 RepID=A0A2K9EGF2_9RHOB|nr:PIN domain-containing protein [Paracoccus tegillarcae]AUH34050.1 PIN domain-containing protein [Paracoccus tegillarcae]
MKAALDANVLYPTVLREILTDIAAAGLYQPVWSQRILDEWRHVATRHGADQALVAGAEIALLIDRFPDALADGWGNRTAGLDLPDPADAHVIEAALNGGADRIVTANLRDFPRPAMSAVGLRAVHPDVFLTDLWAKDPDPVAEAARAAHAKAERIGGAMSFKALMKRARLPRLVRAIMRDAG